MGEIRTLEEWDNINIPPLKFIRTTSNLFDSLCGGIVVGDVSVIAGFTKSGKSLVAFNLACALSTQCKVLYISCENKIQVDMERLKKITHVNKSNLYYYNSSYDNNPSAESLVEGIKKLYDNGEFFNVVFIDGIEYAMHSSGDASKYKAEIDELTKNLVNWLKSKDVSVVLTWQINRTGADKPLEQYNGSEIQSSLGMIQSASHTFVVKRTRDKETKKLSWQLRLLLSRTETLGEHDTIDLLNLNGEFDLFELNRLADGLFGKH